MITADASSSSSEDEFDELGANDSDSPTSSPRNRRGSSSSSGTASPKSPKSPTARALGGVKQRVRRTSVTMMGAVSTVKAVLLLSPGNLPTYQENDSPSNNDADDPPPAKELLRSTMAELDSLLGEVAVRHDGMERGWERAKAARRPPVKPERRPSPSLAMLPALTDTSAQGGGGEPPGMSPGFAGRRWRGGVGAAGQTIMVGMMAVGVEQSPIVAAAKRKPVNPKLLPTLELRDKRERRLRAATFQTGKARGKLERPAPGPRVELKKLGYQFSDTEVDQWLMSQ